MSQSSISAVTVHPDGTLVIAAMPCVDGSTLKALQGAVGGCVDVVRIADDVDMWVNEEGLLLGLPVNRPASALASYFGVSHQVYVGPAVFTGGVDRAGDTVGLGPTRLAEVVELLRSF